jgi:hypothetical protein
MKIPAGSFTATSPGWILALPLILLFMEKAMVLDRSGPYEIFQQHLEEVAAGVANEVHPLASIHSALMLPGAGIVTAVVDYIAILDARNEIFSWLDAGSWTGRNPPDLDAALFDLAGVCLVSAVSLTVQLAGSGPQRQLQHLTSAVKGGLGGHDGKWGFGGMASAFVDYPRDQVAKKALPRYRNFLLASLTRLHVKHRLDKTDVEAVARHYAKGSLSAVGQLPAPANHACVTARSLGQVIVGKKEWYTHLQASPAPLPTWSSQCMNMLRRGEFDSVLGLN